MYACCLLMDIVCTLLSSTFRYDILKKFSSMT